MGLYLLLMLLWPDACGLSSSSVPRHFHVVKEKKTWSEAQHYCRENFTDLATVDSTGEMEKIKSVMQNAGVEEAWIGLQYKPGNESEWRWSLADKGFYGDNETEFRNWYSGEPWKGEDCALIHAYGLWISNPCSDAFRFFCYDGNSTQPYVLIEDSKNWTDAQRYCREHNIDLVSVRNRAENDRLADVTGYNYAWIGLFRNDWRWSDGSTSFFKHWCSGRPSFMNSHQHYCAHISSMGCWTDLDCNTLDSFICYGALSAATVEVVTPTPPFYFGERVTLRCETPKYTSGQKQYVWLKDKSTDPGKTSQTIIISLPDDAGQYQCSGKTEGSSVGSQVSLPVSIEYQRLPGASVEVVSPQSSFYSGDKVTLKCNTTQYTDWHEYSWYKIGDLSPIPGEISQTMNITLPPGAGQCRYQCGAQRRGRPDMSTASQPVTITYQDLPDASVEVLSPQSPFYPGDEVTLKCNTTHYSDWDYYGWNKNGSKVPGESNQTITLTLPPEGGRNDYECFGFRKGCPDRSRISKPTTIMHRDLPNATLVVESPLPFYSGDIITLRCDIREYTNWRQYVWLKDDSSVPGKTSQTINIKLPREAGQYQCSGQREDRPMSSAVSSSVNVSHNAPSAVILSPPPPFNSGDVVTLRCDIPEHTGQHQYIWLKDNSLLPGETSKTITVSRPGQYQCHRQKEESSVEPYISKPLDIKFTPRLAQRVRVRLQVPAGVNVEDDDVQAAFLKQIGDRLKANGLAADAKLSWKKQPDGKVLHREKNDKKKRNRNEL